MKSRNYPCRRLKVREPGDRAKDPFAVGLERVGRVEVHDNLPHQRLSSMQTSDGGHSYLSAVIENEKVVSMTAKDEEGRACFKAEPAGSFELQMWGR